MKEKGEMSNDKLESVAGGHFNDPLVQAIMKLDGFKDEWAQPEKRQKSGGIRYAWDKDFLAFLSNNFEKRKVFCIKAAYKNQDNMFSK